MKTGSPGRGLARRARHFLGHFVLGRPHPEVSALLPFGQSLNLAPPSAERFGQQRKFAKKYPLISEGVFFAKLPQEDDFRNFLNEFRGWCLSEEAERSLSKIV